MEGNMKKVNKLRMRESIVSYCFLAPALVFFLLFVLVPMVMGAVTSFFNYTMTDFSFVGIDNYIKMFGDKVFQKSLINTIIIVIGSVPIVVGFSLFVASQTYERSAFTRSFFRWVFFLPVVTGTVAVTVVWKWIYDPLSGIMNYILKTGHVIDQNIMWLGDKRYALMAIIIILLTTAVGQPIILYIASMGNIDKSLVEAAEVDGANKFQVFWKIKWPSLLPTTLYIVVITTINSFQCFSLIQLLTSGGPNYSTTTIMYYLYEQAFKQSNYGYANTMGVFLALLIGLISFAQFKLLGNDVEY
jgi:multiple sugar transport system permease protein